MNKHENDLIFGDISETVSDVISLEESSLSSMLKTKQAANNMKFKAKNSKNLTASEKHQMEMAANQTINQANIGVNAENRKNDDITKDPLSGEKSLKEDAAETAQRQIDRLNNQIKKENDNHKRKVMRLQQQKQNYENVKQTIDAAEDASNQTNISEENEIEKGEELEAKSVDSLDGKTTEGEKDEPKDKINEGARIQLNPIDPSIENTIKQDRFAKRLFNGTSGEALKYFIYGEINNINRAEISVAKEMKNDKTVISTINKIKWLLARAAKNKFSDQDYLDLKVQKSKFRQLFHSYKNKE